MANSDLTTMGSKETQGKMSQLKSHRKASANIFHLIFADS